VAAVRDRKVASSPCEGIKLPKVEPRQIVPFTTKAVRALGAAVPPRYEALVLLAAGTGLRQAEAFGLTVDLVDFMRRTLKVDRQLVLLARQEPQHGPPKTRPATGPSHSPKVVVLALSRHLELFPAGPSGLIFTDDDGAPLRRPVFSVKVWRPAVSEAGMAGVVFHELRHYYASLLIKHGESVKVVQATQPPPRPSTPTATCGRTPRTRPDQDSDQLGPRSSCGLLAD
jgi:integrase